MKIKSQKDFCSGLMFVLVGLGAGIVSTTYRMGSGARMGPGYFPFWLGVLLAILGAIVLLGSFKAEEDKIGRWDIKSVLWVLGAVALFGALLDSLGMVLSVIVLVIVSSRASHEFSWGGTALNAAVLIAISLAAFVYGLNIQFPVWPSFIDR